MLTWVFIFAFISFVKSSPSFQHDLQNTPLVVTATATWCDSSCDRWQKWIQNIAKQHTNIQFITVDVDSPQAKQYNLTSRKYNQVQDEYIQVPNSVFVTNQQQHNFVGSRTFNGLNIWIQNAIHGQYHPVFTTDNINQLGEWDKRFNASITVISHEEPIFGSILAEIPSLGYAWGMQNYSDTPAIFMRDTQDEISMAFDFQWKGLLKKILPPLIPQETADTDLAVETILFFADYYINIITPDIQPWLNRLSKQYENVAFIVEQKQDKTKQIAFLQKRTVQYKTQDLSIQFVTWFQNIWKGKTRPFYRKSTPPQKQHSWLIDVQGNTLWNYTNNIILYTYSQNTPEQCKHVFQNYKQYSQDIHIGRFDIQNNDHELFPNDARAGFIFHFENNTLKHVLPCETSRHLHNIITLNIQKIEL